MTLIAIIVTLLLSHFVRGLSALRGTDWICAWQRWLQGHCRRLPGFDGVTGVLLVVIPPVLAVALAQIALAGVAHGLASFVFGVAVLIWAWGPRDLDRDVEAYLKAVDGGDSDEQRRAAEAIVPEPLPPGAEDEAETVMAWVYLGALERGFGVVFWFALLGPLGAMLYRVSQVLARRAAERGAPEGFVGAVRRLRRLLDWPVCLLMAMGLAVVGHFDAVIGAWREHYRREGRGFFALDPGFVLAAAHATLAAPPTGWPAEFEERPDVYGRIRISLNLVWRVMFVWATVLALLTLAGWLG